MVGLKMSKFIFRSRFLHKIMRFLNFIRSFSTREDLLQKSLTNASLKYNTIHVQCTRNNTVACLTDINDQVITTASAGMCGLKNSRKKVAESGYVTLTELVKRATLKKIDSSLGFHVKLKGFGVGRDQAFRAIVASGWKILRISDVTPHRHKGCRPPKKRRL